MDTIILDGDVNVTTDSDGKAVINIECDGQSDVVYVIKEIDNPYTGEYSVTPTESTQTLYTADKALTSNVTVGAISSTYVGSDVPQNDSDDLTASGATVTAPAGYYANSASKTVASGTEGTPTATKGAVSNHAIAVTPSVTNTEGYISGGTHTGTAVSVSVSELVSGTKTINENASGIDVTEYAAIDVNVSAVANLQTKSKSYTPTESAQSETVEADVGYDALEAVNVSVGAISSTYVGSGITQRTSSDLTESSGTVTVPAGYYASTASKSVGTAGDELEYGLTDNTLPIIGVGEIDYAEI